MTLCKLYSKINFHGVLTVKSGYNGKVLCYAFNPKKHEELAKREVLSMWADIKKTSNEPGAWAQPVICCFIDGAIEREKEAVDGETD